MSKLNPSIWANIVKESGSKVEGAKNCVKFLRHGLDEKKFSLEQVGLRGVAAALGLVDPSMPDASFRRLAAGQRSGDYYSEQAIYTESNPGIMTDAFHVMTNELVSRAMIEGYNTLGGFIADELVTMQSETQPNSKISGITHLGGGKIIDENMPYPETDFNEKWVQAKEYKWGNMISLTEELVFMDRTGEIVRRAREVGNGLREAWEEYVIDSVLDQNPSTDPVYRPLGVGETLYNTDGSNYNYIGVGNTTSSSFNAAVALGTWQDFESILHYRATEVKDDRIDGDPKPISGLNGPNNLLVVPWALRGTALSLTGTVSNDQAITSGSAVDTAYYRNPTTSFIGRVITSPHVPGTADYWYGDFKKQFVATELWPLQTFSQGANSESAFERDVVLRYKARFWRGVSARDTKLVTKVDGA